MEEGTTVEWTFPEMDASFPVQVKQAEPNKPIRLCWNDIDGSETTVTITLNR